MCVCVRLYCGAGSSHAAQDDYTCRFFRRDEKQWVEGGWSAFLGEGMVCGGGVVFVMWM